MYFSFVTAIQIFDIRRFKEPYLGFIQIWTPIYMNFFSQRPMLSSINILTFPAASPL